MTSLFDASSPADPAVVALYDQASGELRELVDRARRGRIRESAGSE